ncbi:hypothetical protein KIN20_011867 [Parelaphostrongylus tenuis]|uniref:Uncharacterized protein n=1 Tax=Parelaphostrongylus tenuis TaxID=148309 RepID=A0AAD5MSN2_PARTN|nr:hypothetical protein KIN20_011867 [Parelaphostrongylus tenuis]
MADPPSCIVVDNTVTGICDVTQGIEACTTPVPAMVTIVPVPDTYRTISGTISVIITFLLVQIRFVKKSN